MENNFFRRIPTDLDLNGPVLEYTTQPSDVSGDKDASVTFTVAAQALFPGDSGAEDGGTITFQWFEVGGSTTGLINAGQFSGVTTATLTVSDLRTPQDQGRKFYCEISYLQNNEYDSADSGTGTAINQPLKSDEATLSVNPELEIIAQPSSRQVGENVAATFTVNAGLTDDTYLSDGAVTYQWYIGIGNATPTLATNGTFQTTNITSEVVTVEEEGIAYDTETFSESKSFGTGTHNVNIPPTGSNVNFTIAGAAGGRGGDDGGGPGAGGGAGRIGSFTVPSPQAQGRPLSFRIGSKGGDGGRGNFPAYGRSGSGGTAPGGRGGGAGPRGWSGGGGGGGGASGVVRDGLLLVSAGGGGGGGGGSHKIGGRGGLNANTWYPYNGGTIQIFSGGTGGDCPSDGGGGGGGGGGSGGSAGGGETGFDKNRGGGGGSGGNSDYRSDIVSVSNPGLNAGQGYGSISYNYTVTTSRPITTTREETVYTTIKQNTTISGQGTPTLTITSDESSFNSVRRVYAVVSHVTATNSPLTSDTVTSSVVDVADVNNLVIETISSDNSANIQTVNLSNGDQELTAGATDINLGAGAFLYSLYAPDKSLDIEMDLYGAKGIGFDEPGGTGEDWNQYNGQDGGEGGFSRIQFTMERNTEYVIAGLTDSVNTPFVYRKASLIAAVGRGGNGGHYGRGGQGGGVNVAGENGQGRHSGQGGRRFDAGTLITPGLFGSVTSLTADAPDTKSSGNNGGRTLPCPRGIYYRQQGLSACSDIGNVKFRASDGTEITNTGQIDRGYKAGYNIIQTAGSRGSSDGGNGGNGVVGGDAGNSGGGGGGSGYTDGSVTIIDTQLGGSSLSKAKVVIRLGQPPVEGSITHHFNNQTDLNTIFDYDGAITFAVAENPGSPDQQSSYTTDEKHYLITMNKPYNALSVVNVSQQTAGGGGASISLAKLERVDDVQWRIWFKKSNDFTTYVRRFTVEGTGRT